MSEPVQASSWDFSGIFLPQSSSFVIRSISALCAFIGTIFILPLFFFLTIDISLWVWRHLSNHGDGETQNIHPTPPDPIEPDTSSGVSTSATTPDVHRTRKR